MCYVVLDAGSLAFCPVRWRIEGACFWTNIFTVVEFLEVFFEFFNFYFTWNQLHMGQRKMLRTTWLPYGTWSLHITKTPEISEWTLARLIAFTRRTNLPSLVKILLQRAAALKREIYNACDCFPPWLLIILPAFFLCNSADQTERDNLSESNITLSLV